MQELKLLDDESSVYKLIGPALIKQDPLEAKHNVEKRPEFIGHELGRLDGQAKGLDEKRSQKQNQVLLVQTVSLEDVLWLIKVNLACTGSLLRCFMTKSALLLILAGMVSSISPGTSNLAQRIQPQTKKQRCESIKAVAVLSLVPKSLSSTPLL